MADNLPEKSGEVLLALQNRINDLEAKIQKAEKAQEGKKYIDDAALENKIAVFRADIGELLKKKADFVAATDPGVKKSLLEDLFSFLD